jgi:hypothetical protein
MSIIKNQDDKHYRDEMIRVLAEYDIENYGVVNDVIYWDLFDTPTLEVYYKVAMEKVHSVKL